MSGGELEGRVSLRGVAADTSSLLGDWDTVSHCTFFGYVNMK